MRQRTYANTVLLNPFIALSTSGEMLERYRSSVVEGCSISLSGRFSTVIGVHRLQITHQRYVQIHPPFRGSFLLFVSRLDASR